MAAWVCAGCTTTYSVGAPRCPHCGSTEYAEQGAEPMAKITVHEGPSIAGVTASWSEEDAPDVWPAQQQEGGEESSPGTASSTSAETPENEPEPGSKPDRSPARTTGNRSSKAQTAKASSARTTAGARADDTSPTD